MYGIESLRRISRYILYTGFGEWSVPPLLRRGKVKVHVHVAVSSIVHMMPQYSAQRYTASVRKVQNCSSV